MLVAMSLVGLLITIATMVRSYLVMDAFYSNAATQEPLTRAAQRWAADHAIAADYIDHHVTWSVTFMRGRIVLANYETKEPRSHAALEQLPNQSAWRHDQSAVIQPPDWWQRGWLARLGFASEEFSSSTRLYAVYRAATLPLWPIALLTAIAPLVWLKRAAQQWWRRRRGRCVACGYDLRAQPAGRRCPECGALPEETMPDYVRPRAAAAARWVAFPSPAIRTRDVAGRQE